MAAAPIASGAFLGCGVRCEVNNLPAATLGERCLLLVAGVGLTPRHLRRHRRDLSRTGAPRRSLSGHQGGVPHRQGSAATGSTLSRGRWPAIRAVEFAFALAKLAGVLPRGDGSESAGKSATLPAHG